MGQMQGEVESKVKLTVGIIPRPQLEDLGSDRIQKPEMRNRSGWGR